VSGRAPDAASAADTTVDDLAAAHLYLAKVMAEIDEEVLRRRSSGDLPQRVERELDELFLRYSPVAGRDGSLEEALGVVEEASFIDPVVPVDSSKSGGALVKRTIRQATLWYMGWITAQISRFAAATSRTLRVLDDRVRVLQVEFDTQRVPPAPVIETQWAHGAGAWWEVRVLESLAGQRGRVLHTAAGDGWLVRRLGAAGLDAYGIDPRVGRIDRAEVEGLDLREEPVLEHLRAVAADGLGALVLTGVVDWSGGSLGPPGFDVGWCRLDLYLLHGQDVADVFLAAYDAASATAIPAPQLWDLWAVARSHQMVETWVPNYRDLGRTDLTATELRRRHTAWTEQVLARTAGIALR